MLPAGAGLAGDRGGRRPLHLLSSPSLSHPLPLHLHVPPICPACTRAAAAAPVAAVAVVAAAFNIF
jgi:hypothetical protein